ncbi:MAG: molybdopterin synthase catalytic subunit [Nocardioidaceae bacterium]|nr:molybdopterin synthase catalytic subunit [Nocardioidaceae bacterium]
MSGKDQRPAEGSAVRLVDIRSDPIEAGEVLGAVEADAAGGITLFVGTVRDHDSDRPVSHLEYSEHPTARDRLHEVASVVAGRHPGTTVAALHRVGRLEVGDVAVVVAAAAVHRGQAFDAAEDLIDDLKATVPIWKHQVFADGTEEWVGLP